ncbi:MAG: DUF445 domain-containing protein [bacterium]|jgi:uncharacterized membrane protein YheB (UPF0754 family)
MLELLIMPTIGALIGWVTNRIAIRLLFYPHSPWRVPLIGWEIQGLLPKRQAELARTIGETVEKELFSTSDLLAHLNKPELRGGMLKNIAAVVAERVENRVPFFLPGNIRGILFGSLQGFVQREAEAAFNQVLAGVEEQLEAQLSISQLVEAKLLAIDLNELENMVINVAGSELKHIEVLGGILGFMIGLLQAVIILILS